MLAQYKFISDPEIGRQSFQNYLTGMKQLEILDPTTDVDALVEKTFVNLNKV